MGNMPGKIQFRWTWPFWITKEYNGPYQLGTLAGESLDKWMNGLRLKPDKGRMLGNPFQRNEDPEDPENWQEEGQVQAVTDPGHPDTTDN